jgi:hypothetical protein
MSKIQLFSLFNNLLPTQRIVLMDMLYNLRACLSLGFWISKLGFVGTGKVKTKEKLKKVVFTFYEYQLLNK